MLWGQLIDSSMQMVVAEKPFFEKTCLLGQFFPVASVVAIVCSVIVDTSSLVLREGMWLFLTFQALLLRVNSLHCEALGPVSVVAGVPIAGMPDHTHHFFRLFEQPV